MRAPGGKTGAEAPCSEYNLALGDRRAASVSAYLERLGVPDRQLAAPTRGDIDAVGTDETGWQQDRRVDLELRP